MTGCTDAGTWRCNSSSLDERTSSIFSNHFFFVIRCVCLSIYLLGSYEDNISNASDSHVSRLSLPLSLPLLVLIDDIGHRMPMPVLMASRGFVGPGGFRTTGLAGIDSGDDGVDDRTSRRRRNRTGDRTSSSDDDGYRAKRHLSQQQADLSTSR